MSIEERYDEVRQMITVGKEKGYLLYDEINELLPSEITSAEETLAFLGVTVEEFVVIVAILAGG